MKELFSLGHWVQIVRSKAVRLVQVLAGIASSALGNFSWKPPLWLSRTRAASSNFVNLHPRLTLAGLLVAFAFASGAGAILHWYEHRPKPRKVYATVEPIPVTGMDKEHKKLILPSLVVHFTESAARLEDLGTKRPLANVRLE